MPATDQSRNKEQQRKDNPIMSKTAGIPGANQFRRIVVDMYEAVRPKLTTFDTHKSSATQRRMP
jgi:uncharacterized protein (DUF362 family)